MEKPDKQKKGEKGRREDRQTKEDRIIATLDLLAKTITAQSEMLKNLTPVLNTLSTIREKSVGNGDPSQSISTDGDGNVVLTSYDVPSNHLDNTNAFKGKDTDVERFITMCEKQFKYYVRFYSTEEKRVEFIESHLGPASEWYFTFLGNKQKENPNSKLLLDELERYYLTNLPDSLKLKRLKELSHKWGNAVDFVTRFKLYSTQLQIPEILQLQFFEDRVHPLVKRKLMDLEPQRRTIENYSQMLISYDNERDRHWDFEKGRKRGLLDEDDHSKDKRYKLRNYRKEENKDNNYRNKTNNGNGNYNYNNNNNKNNNIKDNNNNYNNNNYNFNNNKINGNTANNQRKNLK